MRLSDLEGKEIVNARDGERLGVLDARDVILNTQTGKLEGVVVPVKGSLSLGSWDKRHALIPWSAVKTVGKDIIIVDLGQPQSSESKMAEDPEGLVW